MHLDKRKAFTLDENIRKAQRKEEISAKKQKRYELINAAKSDIIDDKDNFDADEDVEVEKEKLTNAQKKQNRATLGTFSENSADLSQIFVKKYLSYFLLRLCWH